MEPARIVYRADATLEPEAFVELLRDSTLGARRPVDEPAVIADMLRHGNLMVTAWDGERLVGASRSLTDFTYVAYLSDLVVRDSYQRRGIGTELIAETRRHLGPNALLVLLAAPQAVDYYPRVGFTAHTSAWILRGADPFPTSSSAAL